MFSTSWARSEGAQLACYFILFQTNLSVWLCEHQSVHLWVLLFSHFLDDWNESEEWQTPNCAGWLQALFISLPRTGWPGRRSSTPAQKYIFKVTPPRQVGGARVVEYLCSLYGEECWCADACGWFRVRCILMDLIQIKGALSLGNVPNPCCVTRKQALEIWPAPLVNNKRLKSLFYSYKQVMIIVLWKILCQFRFYKDNINQHVTSPCYYTTTSLGGDRTSVSRHLSPMATAIQQVIMSSATKKDES